MSERFSFHGDVKCISSNIFHKTRQNEHRLGHIAHTFSRLLSDILIWERFISISIRFQMNDNDTFLAISPADLITATETIDHVCKIPCLLLRFLFLTWTPLNIKGRSKMKRTGWRYKSTLNIEFEQDWSVGLGAKLGDR